MPLSAICYAACYHYSCGMIVCCFCLQSCLQKVFEDGRSTAPLSKLSSKGRASPIEPQSPTVNSHGQQQSPHSTTLSLTTRSSTSNTNEGLLNYLRKSVTSYESPSTREHNLHTPSYLPSRVPDHCPYLTVATDINPESDTCDALALKGVDAHSKFKSRDTSAHDSSLCTSARVNEPTSATQFTASVSSPPAKHRAAPSALQSDSMKRPLPSDGHKGARTKRKRCWWRCDERGRSLSL